MSALKSVLKEALSLDVDSRATLAKRLLESLDDLSEAETDQLWADEAERRLKAFRAGKTTAVPSEQVFKRARKLLR